MTRTKLLSAAVTLALICPALLHLNHSTGTMPSGWLGVILGLIGAVPFCMSAGNTFEDSLLKHIFQNTDVANIGDATGIRGSTTAGSLYIALHTADPGEAGNQSTSESAYTGYARVAVARTSGAFTISGTAPTQVANAAIVTYGLCTAGSETLTHFSIGVASSGATVLLLSGALTAPLNVSNGITPNFAIGALVATLD